MRTIFKTLTSLVLSNTSVLADTLDAEFSSSCPKSTYRVDSIPYFVGSEIPCSYSGNLSSSDKYDNHYFFWLFPKPNEQENKANPLIIYMNGGPGSSSMNALFMENGPLRAF